VACQELQLERLERRFAAFSGLSPSIFFWRASPSGGRFEGLYAPQGVHFVAEDFLRDEEQLSFEIYFKSEALLLNPARLPLVETTLARRDVESTLREPNPDLDFDVSFEAAGGAINPLYPRVPVQISGVHSERSATRVGRGPLEDDLLSACQPEPTATDAKILRLISRSLRPTCWASPAVCNTFGFRYKVTLYRAEEPYTYRANIYTYVYDCEDEDPPETQCPYSEPERIVLEFRFHRSAGRLTTGTVRILPACSGGQTTGCSTQEPFFSQGIFVLPPLWAGHETQGNEALARGAYLSYLYQGFEDNVFSADLDWADLLKDTVWNEGFD
jgi:hypothetical protein